MIFILFVALFVLFGIAFLLQPKFGKMPSGTHLNELVRSPYYDSKKGAFQNLSPTPALTEGASYGEVLKAFLFTKNARSKPKGSLSTLKTDLFKLKSNEDVLVWFGHSSYFIKLDGVTILVDPVFSGSASPLPFSITAFKGSDIYSAQDIPEIDYLFITHDHWDHMDYTTLTALQPKIKKVICGLGVGAHLQYWGFDEEIIVEKDWHQSIFLEYGFEAHTVPARHFSGRRFKRNGTLWTSFVLKTPSYRLFLGGDSGFDTHFEEVGEKFGPFDLVILENGQYNANWKYIHMHPEEVLRAAKALKARRLLPVHSGKFALAHHDWDEPLNLISELHKEDTFKLVTPKIGESVFLNKPSQTFKKWWLEVE